MKLISKSDTQKFLQDVADLETKAFTLEKLADSSDQYSEDQKVQKQIEGLCTKFEELQDNDGDDMRLSYHESNVQSISDKLAKLQAQYKQTEQEYATLVLPKKTDNVDVEIDKDTLSSAVGTGVGNGCLLSVGIVIGIMILLLIITGWNVGVALILSFWLGVPISSILCVRGAKKAKKKAKVKEYISQKNAYYQGLLEKLKREIGKTKEELRWKQGLLEDYRREYEAKRNRLAEARNEIESELQELKRKKSIADKEKELATAFAQSCRQSAQTIRGNLAKIYEAADLIPPDYREMDCVLAFQQIFRNDLADTMREAVMIYEQRVFRQEVVRGMDRIYRQLQNLNSSMYYIQNTLTNIRNNVSMMSQDLFQVVGKMDRMSRQMNDNSELQVKLLRETQASRYAVDAIKQSQNKCVEYLEKVQSSSESLEKRAADWDWERKHNG